MNKKLLQMWVAIMVKNIQFLSLTDKMPSKQRLLVFLLIAEIKQDMLLAVFVMMSIALSGS
jgi:hypothetical protein